MSHPLNTAKSITLVELLISIVIVTIMVLSFYGLETFSREQLINSDRRAKVQNQLAYVLDHMSKYVQQANGDKNNPPIKLYPDAGPYAGFQVRVDFRDPQVPSDLNNGAWVSYFLSGNTLSTNCSPYGATGTCGSFPATAEALSNKIIGNFVADTIMPNNPTDGFYVKVDPSGNLVDIGLVGRYDPSQPYTLATRSKNPQVELKTRIICSNSSTN